MMHPEFKPVLPPKWKYAIVGVRMVKGASLIIYDTVAPSGYAEQRVACVVNDRAIWDMISWHDESSGHVKEYRAQKVERVRLKEKRVRLR